jgi:hypothetical protein
MDTDAAADPHQSHAFQSVFKARFTRESGDCWGDAAAWPGPEQPSGITAL